VENLFTKVEGGRKGRNRKRAAAQLLSFILHPSSFRLLPPSALIMLIQVFGPGCPQCADLAANAEAAVRELGIDATVQRVTDITAIIESGVLLVPALAIDGEVRAVGRVLSKEAVKGLLLPPKPL
jgi:small redox-active disulfide protein 2